MPKTSPEKALIYLLPALITAWITYLFSFHALIVFDYSIIIDRSWRIATGEVPYKDFFMPTAPYTFLVQAAILKFIGPKVLWMKIYLAAMNALLVGVAVYFTRELLKIPARWLWTAVVPITIAWSPGIIIMRPWYDFDANLFAFCSLVSLSAAALRGRELFYFIAGLATGLSLTSKQNIGAGSLVSSFLFILIQPGGWREKAKHVLFFAFGCAIPGIALLGYLAANDAVKEGIDWMILRPAAQKAVGGNFLKQASRVFLNPINNFVKLVFFLYIGGLLASWRRRRQDVQEGSLRLGIVLYGFLTMWFGCLAEAGNDYPGQQIYLGALAGILLTSADPETESFGWKAAVRRPALLLTAAMAVVVLLWPVHKFWYVPLKFGTIKYTPDQERVRGLYFHYADYKVVQSLLDFEKKIPKEQEIFLWPDPVFFYFATGRKNPTRQSCFNPPSIESPPEELAQINDYLTERRVPWVVVGQETYFDYGWLRFGVNENWQAAVKRGIALSTRVSAYGDYSLLRDYLYKHYEEAPGGPTGFWLLRRKTHSDKA